MGDMADWSIDQGMAAEAQEIESWSRARSLPDAEIVEVLENHDDSEENILSEDKATKVKNICSWYREKGFLTKKQRACLNAAFTDLDLVL